MQPIVRLSAIAAAIAATLAVAGCAEPPPPVIPTSQPGTAPVFATDADALAAAEKAFAGYLAASDQVAQGGGKQVALLKPWVTSEQLDRDAVTFGEMSKAGRHTTGSSAFSYFSLESSVTESRRARFVAYICTRLDGTKLWDSAGNDVGEDRTLAMPLEVSFVGDAPQSTRLVVDRSVRWSGTDFC